MGCRRAGVLVRLVVRSTESGLISYVPAVVFALCAVARDTRPAKAKVAKERMLEIIRDYKKLRTVLTVSFWSPKARNHTAYLFFVYTYMRQSVRGEASVSID